MSTKRYNKFLSILRQARVADGDQGFSSEKDVPQKKYVWIIDYNENILRKALHKPMKLDEALGIANTLNKLFPDKYPPFHVDEIKKKNAFTGKDYEHDIGKNPNLYIVKYIPSRIDYLKKILMNESDANKMLGNLNIMLFPDKPFYKRPVKQKEAGKVTERDLGPIDPEKEKGFWVMDYDQDFLNRLKSRKFTFKDFQRIFGFLENELSGAFSGRKVK